MDGAGGAWVSTCATVGMDVVDRTSRKIRSRRSRRKREQKEKDLRSIQSRAIQSRNRVIHQDHELKKQSKLPHTNRIVSMILYVFYNRAKYVSERFQQQLMVSYQL